jgi:hypothetical protein
MPNTTTTTSPGRPTSHNPAQRDLTRVLAELEAAPAGVVTVDALLERGVQRPAQAIYTLQLTGHAIHRVAWTDPRGHRALGYQLRDTGEACPTSVDAQPGSRS